MYRSSLVRDRQPFYDEWLLHEDTEKCMQILERWDFGFVLQVLSFSASRQRIHLLRSRIFQPDALDRYIIVQRYAARVPGSERSCGSEEKVPSGSITASWPRAASTSRRPTFWQYHEGGLKTLGEKLDWPYLTLQFARNLLRKAANPGTTAIRGLHCLRRKIRMESRAENRLVSGNESAPPSTGPSSPRGMSTQPNGPPNSQDSQTTQADKQMSSPLVSVVMAICNLIAF